MVALPGDTVSIVDGHVIRNGSREPDAYTAPCGFSSACDFRTPMVIPPGDYFVLGDNRGVSDDSRLWSPVPQRSIIGVVVSCSFLWIRCHPLR